MQNVKWIGAIGAVLYVVALFVLDAIPGGGPAVDPAEFEQFYVTDERTLLALGGAFLAGFGALALLWFLWQLRVEIGAPLAELGFISGALGLAQVAVGASLLVAPAGMQAISGSSFIGTPVAHAFASAGWSTALIGGGLFLGLGIAVISAAARRTGSLPSWVTIVGFVAGALQLAAALFIPHFAVPIWLFLAAATGIRPGTVTEGKAARSAAALRP